MEPTDFIQLLLDCLQKNTPVDAARLSALSPESWQSLLALAATQRVRPLLWHSLKQKGLVDVIPSRVAEQLREASRRNTLRNLRLYVELRLLLSALKAEGIPLILLKGIYLADAVYDSIGLREMNDIDVLARPTDLKRIADILAGMGYTSPGLLCPDSTIKTSHHLPRMIKEGHAGFEIHWNLLGPDEIGYTAPDSFWERAVTFRVAGCDALALSPVDLLLHLCYHTSFHHRFAFGLRPSYDIAAIIVHFGSTLDWLCVVSRASQLGWQRGVYLALRLAQEQAAAPVPDDVMAMLRPADMTETILATARAQLFSDKCDTASITLSYGKLLESRSAFDKCRIFWQRVFVSKAYMALIYAIPVDSIRIYGYYPFRVFDLLRRHGHTLIKYQHYDDPLKNVVERANCISNWLDDPPILPK